MRTTAGVVAALAVCLVSGHAIAQGVSIDGIWSGGGYAELSGGQREKVRCRVRYTRETPDVYGVSAVCASPSVKVTQTGTISRVGSNRFIGDLYNPEYDVAGRVRVVVSGSTQTVTMSSSRGSGNLTLSR